MVNIKDDLSSIIYSNLKIFHLEKNVTGHFLLEPVCSTLTTLQI